MIKRAPLGLVGYSEIINKKSETFNYLEKSLNNLRISSGMNLFVEDNRIGFEKNGKTKWEGVRTLKF